MTASDKLGSPGGRRLLIFGGGGAGAVMAILGFALARTPAPASDPVSGSEALGAAAPSSAAPPAEDPSPSPSADAARGVGSAAAPPTKAAVSSTVKVTLRVFPAVPATVTLGKTRLGTISPRGALVLERRRDSGPLDLVIRAGGYVPVHTRAYTFDNNTVEVRLTPLDKKDTLYGYRQPLPPEEDPTASASAATPGLRPWVSLSALLAPPPAPSSAPPAPRRP